MQCGSLIDARAFRLSTNALKLGDEDVVGLYRKLNVSVAAGSLASTGRVATSRA
jgi:hypothetical protein